MSRNLFRAAQSTFRHSASRPTSIASFQQFHNTSPKMTVHNIQTAEAFKEAVQQNKVVLLDCFATWCGPCKAIAPILANHSNEEEFKDVFFAKIDVDDLPELSQELGITAMPTFMVFKDGNLVPAEKLVGANPNALVSMLKKHA
ncbi:thioredoxin-domain-containing protein [Hypoxylon fragiforme]|uniref:thioredoxin-domain-containing protein n=1 Tax=Hypoxylon fragiforme TaxID=63214 RepID=UPI0020C6E567|nr:thioredoxin-domain-containing protein [Hypoxylon fragiforme]KAI2614364.1 thioredoxin-domain-containing protein [Hypoxylon fragiforme]